MFDVYAKWKLFLFFMYSLILFSSHKWCNGMVLLSQNMYLKWNAMVGSHNFITRQVAKFIESIPTSYKEAQLSLFIQFTIDSKTSTHLWVILLYVPLNVFIKFWIYSCMIIDNFVKVFPLELWSCSRISQTFIFWVLLYILLHYCMSDRILTWWLP